MPTDRVLYVDDEDDIREVAVISLELGGIFHVRACSSGADALEEAARWLPDIILLDVMMPGMDGPETLTNLRSRSSTAAIPVIFITARAQSHEVAHLLQLGAVGVIAKPFEPVELATRVMSFLRADR